MIKKLAMVLGIGAFALFGCAEKEEVKEGVKLEQEVERSIEKYKGTKERFKRSLRTPEPRFNNKESLFEYLTTIDGTYLHSLTTSSQEFEKDILEKKRANFGTDYQDFVYDVADAVGFFYWYDVSDEIKAQVLVSAENIANKMNPKANFKRDLFNQCYAFALDEINWKMFPPQSRKFIKCGRDLGKENGFETLFHEKRLIEASKTNAKKHMKAKNYGVAEKDIQMGRELAVENGLKDYVDMFDRLAK